MDLVTFTDHNRIEGCLEIADRAGVFISEQVSTRFPDDRCEVPAARSPADVLALWKADFARYGKLVKEAGIKGES